MSNSGLFISIEGIDGAGKSTHLQALAQALRAAGRSVCLTREPGGTPLAEALRELVLHQPMDALTEALLVFAARRDHVQQCIAPALARGEVVLSDRFADASFAYQGGGRGVDWGCLAQLERWVQADAAAPGQVLLQPALTLWFDVPPEVAAQRLAGARLPDRFEAQPLAFFAAVRAAYARRADADPTRWVRIDAQRDVAAVGQAALQALRDRGWVA
ncbi:MAG: dTMP kinase [Rhodoferax sp.]